MAINKINFGLNTLIDLTEDTVTPEVLREGFTAHSKTGQVITGTLNTVPLSPLEYDWNIGYISNGTWTYQNPTRTYTDIYEVQANHGYLISLGKNVGTRFRVMFTTVDIRDKTSKVSGVSIVNTNNPASFASKGYIPTEDGYILVAKDNVGKSGIFSYVFDQSKWI